MFLLWYGQALQQLFYTVAEQSTFKVPVSKGNELRCIMNNQSAYADYLCSIHVFILDEASMISKPVPESIDALMQDIYQPPLPFGESLFWVAILGRHCQFQSHKTITPSIVTKKFKMIGLNLSSCL